jgi:hypothetical protein
MAKRSISVSTFTPTATADATNLVDDTFFSVLLGGSSTQKIVTSEIYLGGQAAASAPTIMVLARDSTIAATVIAGTEHRDAALDEASAALAAAPVTGRSMTTQPQRSATLHLLNLSFNAFGGIVRWLAPPGGEISQVGNTASLGETSLSAFTGGTPGLMGGHWIYEPL